MAETSFDILIIGSGPGGYIAAIRAAQLGFKTAIVESKYLGGICLNWGCIPTKALLRSSEINHLLHNLKDYGFSADNIKFDIGAVVKRSRGVAKQLSSGVAHPANSAPRAPIINIRNMVAPVASFFQITLRVRSAAMVPCEVFLRISPLADRVDHQNS